MRGEVIETDGSSVLNAAYVRRMSELYSDRCLPQNFFSPCAELRKQEHPSRMLLSAYFTRLLPLYPRVARFAFFIRRCRQDEIRRNIIQLAQLHKMPYRQLACAALVPRVHRLGGAEVLRDLRLRQIVIFAQCSEFINMIHAITVLRFFISVAKYTYLLLTLVNMCTIILP